MYISNSRLRPCMITPYIYTVCKHFQGFVIHYDIYRMRMILIMRAYPSAIFGRNSFAFSSGLFHLNIHGGGGGVERSPIKKSWGEGVKMKKKSLGEGSVKY